MSALHQLFSAYKIETCPCHNDSTPLNYMMTQEKDKKNRSIKLIGNTQAIMIFFGILLILP